MTSNRHYNYYQAVLQYLLIPNTILTNYVFMLILKEIDKFISNFQTIYVFLSDDQVIKYKMYTFHNKIL